MELLAGVGVLALTNASDGDYSAMSRMAGQISQFLRAHAPTLTAFGIQTGPFAGARLH